ncbi:MAG: cytochrome c [Variibacter sp.]|nr:cytochrome c [Variibacter sp.]
MLRTLVLLVALTAWGPLASGQGAGPGSSSAPVQPAPQVVRADRGESAVRRLCAECHAIGRGETLSPNTEAPPFQTIARTRGMTRTALLVFLRSPHRSMPNLVLEGDDADDVIDYILSLAR